MARIKDREQAIVLRKQGKSYSEIRQALGVSKSTLSGWLHEYPLSPDDLKRLRDTSPRRIESYRATMQAKRDARLATVLERVRSDIGILSARDKKVAGLFLYWAEGTKRARYTTALANTDPAMIKFFLGWLRDFGVPEHKIGIRLQLYADMDAEYEELWWQKCLCLGEEHFKKPFKKKVSRTQLTYKGGHGHGTCNVLVHGRDLYEYIIMSLEYFRESFGEE